MRFVFIAAEKASYPVRLLCRCLAVSRSGFYAWARRKPCARLRRDAQLAVEVAASHTASRGTYGSTRVLRDLREKKIPVSRKRIARLMREGGLVARRCRRFRVTTNSNHAFPVAANVLMREFRVDAPNVAWATDITYVATQEGWLYLAVILDLFSRRVVGFAMSDRITQELALDALSQARARRPGIRDLIHHSDRGSQYASHAYRRALEQAGITCSMSRRGNCWDNAVAESFFATLKVELLHGLPLLARATAERKIIEYIEDFYNVRRRHSSLDYLSPMAFELQHATREAEGYALGLPGRSEGRRDQESPGSAV
ncbi:IS3 family transposase [Myxococcota bacterium]|nr:IS3 family transposase [Myxococcota bacterium]